MRYVILLAMLLCLPVRGEAWQVVGGGASGGGTITVLDDDLYETSTTSIANHTPAPGPGGDWTTTALDTNYIQVGSESKARAVYNTTTAFAVSASSPFTLGGVTATGRAGTAISSRNFSACLFSNSVFSSISDVDGYCGYIDGLGSLVLKRFVDGLATGIATGGECTGFSLADEYDLILTASSDNYYSVTLKSGETTVCSVSPTQDTTFTGAKYPGMAINHNYAWVSDIKGFSND